MIARLDVEYPALTRRPPARDGMVVHQLFDTSMYVGTAAQARYLAAANGTERKAALQEMPGATVTFIEAREGEPFMAMTDEFD